MQHYDNFINGRFAASSSKDRLEVLNPATQQPICTVPESSQADLDSALSAAETAQRGWAKLPAIERARPLRALAERIRHHAEPLARVITEEQGKPLGLAKVEVAFAADYVDYMSSGPGASRARFWRVTAPGKRSSSSANRSGYWRYPALELSLLPHRPQGRSRAGHRQHDRDQAQ